MASTRHSNRRMFMTPRDTSRLATRITGRAPATTSGHGVVELVVSLSVSGRPTSNCRPDPMHTIGSADVGECPVTSWSPRPRARMAGGGEALDVDSRRRPQTPDRPPRAKIVRRLAAAIGVTSSVPKRVRVPL
jgi:hypothetical protein